MRPRAAPIALGAGVGRTDRLGRAGEDVREEAAAADIVSVTISFNDSTMPDAKRLAAFSREYETTLDGILTEIDDLRRRQAYCRSR